MCHSTLPPLLLSIEAACVDCGEEMPCLGKLEGGAGSQVGVHVFVRVCVFVCDDACEAACVDCKEETPYDLKQLEGGQAARCVHVCVCVCLCTLHFEHRNVWVVVSGCRCMCGYCCI
jgi:hypothetical protein